MNIGELAKLSGVNSKLIRHYEVIGLIPKAHRTYSGYRKYSDKDIHVLRFIGQARRVGYSIKEIKQLVGLWKNHGKASKQVKVLAINHLRSLENKILEIQKMTAALKHLVQNCHGSSRPDFPIFKT